MTKLGQDVEVRAHYPILSFSFNWGSVYALLNKGVPSVSGGVEPLVAESVRFPVGEPALQGTRDVTNKDWIGIGFSFFLSKSQVLTDRLSDRNKIELKRHYI